MAELPVEKMLISEVLQKVSNAKTKKEKILKSHVNISNLDEKDKEMLSEDIREVASCFIQETLYTVSMIYSAFGRYDQAKECLLKSIKYAEELNGKRHIGTTIFYQELGDVCLKMGDLETATEMTELAMLLRKKYMPSNTLSARVRMAGP